MPERRRKLEDALAARNARSRSLLGARRRRRRLAPTLAAASLLSALTLAPVAFADEGSGAPPAAEGDGTWPELAPEPAAKPPPKKPPPFVVYQPPPPEPAPVTSPPSRALTDDAPEHHFEVGIGGTMFPGSVGGAKFSGSGRPVQFPGKVGFSKTGREVGLRNPTFWGGELTLGYRHTYFGVLVTGHYAKTTHADATPADYPASSVVAPGSTVVAGGGLEIFGAIPIGRLTISAGAQGGLRQYRMPMTGFEPTVCTSRRRKYACAEEASTPAMLYLQPRIHFDIALDRSRSIFFGGYGGLDALGEQSVVAGLVLGFRIPVGGR